MRTNRRRGIITGGIAAALLGIAAGTTRAQVVGWPLQTFYGNICGWNSYANVTLSYDATQDNTGDGGGSCRVSTAYTGSGSGLFYVTVNNVSCCFCGLGATLDLTNFVSVDFDVKWDNSSTVSLSSFNNSFRGGIPIGVGSYTAIASFTVPAAATNGWAHVSAAINPALTNTFAGLALESPFADSSAGNAAFWLDNVELVGRTTNFFAVTPVSASAGAFTVKWNSSPGYTYTVQRSSDMSGWTSLVRGYPVGGATGTSVSYTDTNAPPAHALYRVSSP
jgi:hypothetical protein